MLDLGMRRLAESSVCASIEHSLGCNQLAFVARPTAQDVVDTATGLTFEAIADAIIMPQLACMLAQRSLEFWSSLRCEFANLQKTFRIRSGQ